MKKIIPAVLVAALILVNGTSAREPTKAVEISGFVPVKLDINTNWVSPSPSMDSFRGVIPLPTPPLIILTVPTRTVHTVNESKSYALAVLGAVQYSCIDKIFTQESNWRTTAHNSTSGAYGIPQALPGSKMSVISDDWRSNPVTQVKWGIRYVNGRYGSACDAWRFKQVNGWY